MKLVKKKMLRKAWGLILSLVMFAALLPGMQAQAQEESAEPVAEDLIKQNETQAYNENPNIMRGDVNLDGKVNLEDVVLVLKHLFKITPLSEDSSPDSLIAADATNDGRIDLNDAQCILSCALGITIIDSDSHWENKTNEYTISGSVVIDKSSATMTETIYADGNLSMFDIGVAYNSLYETPINIEWNSDFRQYLNKHYGISLNNIFDESLGYIVLGGVTATDTTYSGEVAKITYQLTDHYSDHALFICKDTISIIERMEAAGEDGTLLSAAKPEELTEVEVVPPVIQDGPGQTNAPSTAQPTNMPPTNPAQPTNAPVMTHEPTNIMRGDVTLDGKIDLNDVTVILQHSINKIILIGDESLNAADATYDGKIDLNDAQCVLSCALGITIIDSDSKWENKTNQYTISASAVVDEESSTMTETIYADGNLSMFDIGVAYNRIYETPTNITWDPDFIQYLNASHGVYDNHIFTGSEYVVLSGVTIDTDTAYSGKIAEITYQLTDHYSDHALFICKDTISIIKRMEAAEESRTLLSAAKTEELTEVSQNGRPTTTPPVQYPTTTDVVTPEPVKKEDIVAAAEVVNQVLELIKEIAEQVVNIITDAAPVLNREIFDQMLENGKDLTITVSNEKQEKIYEWNFEMQKLQNTDMEVDLGITISDDKAAIPEIEQMQSEGNTISILGIACAHQGALPGTANLHAYVGNKFKNGEKVYLYKKAQQNQAKQQTKIQADSKEALAIVDKTGTIVTDGYVDLKISEGAIYLLSTELLPEAAEEPVLEEEWKFADLDGNGDVNLEDAKMALEAALGITSLTSVQKACANVNQDANVDLTDANMILRIALGIDKLEDVQK